MVDPQKFDEFFRASMPARPLRLQVEATCGDHDVLMRPTPGGAGAAADGSESVRVACPHEGCGVSVVLWLRQAPKEAEG